MGLSIRRQPQLHPARRRRRFVRRTARARRRAETLAQERPRPRDPRLHERAGPRIRVGRRRRGRSARARADAADSRGRGHQDARRGKGGSGARAGGRAGRRVASQILVRPQTRHPCKRKAKRFRGLEQKENISLTAYVGFPVAPTFMIWSSDLGSGWIRWPHDSTALSTRIIPDDAAHSHWPTLEQQGERLRADAKAFLKSGAKLWCRPSGVQTITAKMGNLLSFLSFHIRACPTANPSV
jgi:hypothetical protein